VRVIAGSARGRRIEVPAGAATRPTTDRVREALFSAIVSWAGTGDLAPEGSLSGLGLCDLYAGSGAIGLEAASRGASPVLLVEADRRMAALAGRNAANLGLRAEVRAVRVEALLGRPAPRAFEVMVADPPYELDSVQVSALLAEAVAGGWLAAHGLAVVERSRRSPGLRWPDVFSHSWTKTYGETLLEFGDLDNLPATEGGA
jgi:16S rRNA (guanine966-N2)-methyltransferase